MPILQLTKDLVQIPSQSGNIPALRECINYCKSYFKDKNVFIKETESNNLPSVLISNTETMDFDVIQISHVDVVPAEERMFNPVEKDGILYGRGVIDMKSLVATSLKVLENVVNNNFNVKYGTLIVSDEETGGFHGANHWVNNLGIRSKVVLDPDGGKHINTIINKAKGVVMVKLVAKGEEAHGSRPWQGVDANEHLLRTIFNLRKHFDYYSKTKHPEDKWVSTMHVGIMSGGDATNKIASYAEAKLDFRLIESMKKEDLIEIIEKSLDENVTYEVLIEGSNVFSDVNNKYLRRYARCIEDKTGSPTVFEGAHGASDGRFFAEKGMPIIMHQGTGGGLHRKDEWVDIKSLYQLENIQTEFLKSFNS